MRPTLLVAVFMVVSQGAIANEAFIPQSHAALAINQRLAGGATAAWTVAVPLTPAVASPTSALSGTASNLPSNVSDITQQGSKNLALVSQAGGLNRSTIAQTGSGNQATVTQRR